MSHHEKNIAVSLSSGLIVFLVYVVYVVRMVNDGRVDGPEASRLVGWSPFIMIGGGIVLTIVLHILWTIFLAIRKKDEESFVTDERDRLIELKGLKLSFLTFCFLFLAMMGTLAMDYVGPYLVLLLIVGCLYVAGILGEIRKLVLYRRDM